jgi:hypothetical protein
VVRPVNGLFGNNTQGGLQSVEIGYRLTYLDNG